ncbi:MAG: TetR/AcrR family transcriptional regulator [Campylobacterota bacterium]|nr:TetR/AcrR family transcriptional regulator [Campylobacterota bacterium]
MAIIVDKVQKRRDIAFSCKELFVQNGINSLTISQIAKVAGVGKGTIYEYFKNKEEIVFELVNIMMQEHSKKLQVTLSEQNSIKNMIKKFAEFFYTAENSQLRTIYKEFISISLVTPNKEMLAFQTECFNNYYTWFEEIFKRGVEEGELIPQSLGLTRGIFVSAEGMFIASATTNAIDDLEKDLNEYIETLFELIEVK